MIYSGEFIDRLLREDVPSLDLTSWTLGIRNQPGVLCFTAREPMVTAGTDVVRGIFKKLEIEVVSARNDGAVVAAGEKILDGRGGAEALHAAWKVSLNVLEHCGGIAIRTRRLVERAKAVHPEIEVVTTRKNFPGTKELAITGILAGGALPHRLGLSETILAFAQHQIFFGGFDRLAARIPTWKKQVAEKKVVVEVQSLDEAQRLAAAGVDGLQFDKVAPGQLAEWVGVLKREYPSLVLIAAGGINEDNVAAYAATGVGVIATSAVYFGKPADIKVEMRPVD